MGTKINLEKLANIQKNIYTLTGVRVSIYDSSYRLINFYPEPIQHTPVCRVIRSCPEGFHRCNTSDISGFNMAKKTRSLFTHKCHAGLTESVLPIIVDGQILCYILLGQYLNDDSSIENQIEDIVKSTSSFTDLRILDDYIRCLPRVSSTKINAAFSLMQDIIISEGIVKLNIDENFEKIEKYIITHLSDSDININILSDHVKLPANRVRKCISDNANMSVVNFITCLRIEKAKELLSSTTLPVSEIASSVGFPDYNYFSRVFKKTVGSTPVSFRKINTGEQNLLLNAYESDALLKEDHIRLMRETTLRVPMDNL